MSRTFGFVLTDSDGDLLRHVCELRRESISGFVKRSILRELARLGFIGQEESEAILREVGP